MLPRGVVGRLCVVPTLVAEKLAGGMKRSSTYTLDAPIGVLGALSRTGEAT